MTQFCIGTIQMHEGYIRKRTVIRRDKKNTRIGYSGISKKNNRLEFYFESKKKKQKKTKLNLSNRKFLFVRFILKANT